MFGKFGSSGVVVRMLGRRWVLLESGLLYSQYSLSKPLASSTRQARVVGGRWTLRILVWSAFGRFWRKAYILVVSLDWERVA